MLPLDPDSLKRARVCESPSIFRRRRSHHPFVACSTIETAAARLSDDRHFISSFESVEATKQAGMPSFSNPHRTHPCGFLSKGSNRSLSSYLRARAAGSTSTATTFEGSVLRMNRTTDAASWTEKTRASISDLLSPSSLLKVLGISFATIARKFSIRFERAHMRSLGVRRYVRKRLKIRCKFGGFSTQTM